MPVPEPVEGDDWDDWVRRFPNRRLGTPGFSRIAVTELIASGFNRRSGNVAGNAVRVQVPTGTGMPGSDGTEGG